MYLNLCLLFFQCTRLNTIVILKLPIIAKTSCKPRTNKSDKIHTTSDILQIHQPTVGQRVGLSLDPYPTRTWRKKHIARI